MPSAILIKQELAGQEKLTQFLHMYKRTKGHLAEVTPEGGVGFLHLLAHSGSHTSRQTPTALPGVGVGEFGGETGTRPEVPPSAAGSRLQARNYHHRTTKGSICPLALPEKWCLSVRT